MPPLTALQQSILAEILGFQPELLIDDLLDSGYDAISKATEALEAYLESDWLPDKPPKDQEEVMAGLVSFHTLLQDHMNKAFDAFEHWSLNNVFALPKEDGEDGAKIVLPHQKGLDLTATEEEETKLTREIEELRRKVAAQKRLQARLRLAVRLSRKRTSLSEARLEKLRFLSTLKDAVELPSEIQTLLTKLTSLPPLPPPSNPPSQDWQQSHASYLDWAVKTTLQRQGGGGAGGQEDAQMRDIEEEIENVGRVEDMADVARRR